MPLTVNQSALEVNFRLVVERAKRYSNKLVSSREQRLPVKLKRSRNVIACAVLTFTVARFYE